MKGEKEEHAQKKTKNPTLKGRVKGGSGYVKGYTGDN